MTLATESPASVRAELHVLRKFVPPHQLSFISSLLAGEEGPFFRQKLLEVATQVRGMPVTGRSGDGEPIVHLHYFRGSADVWVLERDVGDGTETPGLGTQHQAFGYVDLGYGPELGYISLPELFRAGMELDLHWTPKPASEVLKAHGERMAA